MDIPACDGLFFVLALSLGQIDTELHSLALLRAGHFVKTDPMPGAGMCAGVKRSAWAGGRAYHVPGLCDCGVCGQACLPCARLVRKPTTVCPDVSKPAICGPVKHFSGNKVP